MAKIKKVKNKTDIKRHPALIVACILVFLVAGLGAYWFLTRYSENNSTETTEEKTSESSEVVEEVEENTEAEVEVEEEETTQYEGDNANTYEELTGAISSASVMRGNLSVYITIAQSLTDGSCTLILKNGNEEMNYTADITMDVQTAMCNFEEDVSQLTSGTWQIEVLLESGERVGSLTGEVEI